jgi:dipeptidyl-peptidase-4
MCCAIPASAQKKPVTLDDLASAGRFMRPGGPSAPVWSPRGGRFVFRENGKVLLYELKNQSRRELFLIADLEKKASKPDSNPVMTWENRNTREEALQWSSAGDQLLAVANGDLFLWSEKDGKVEQLTATRDAERDPKLSPDGTRVSFRRDNDLYVLTISSKEVTRLTHDGSDTVLNAKPDWVYPEELDLGTAHWWSPDSQSISYLQFSVAREHIYPHGDHLPVQAVSEPQRYPKAGTPNADVRVGVVRAGGGATRWMDYGEVRDALIARVHWTPDSRRVVVHRLNRVQNDLKLLAADASTGESSLLIRETDPHWINLTDDFRILNDGRILRTSERSGFRHVYLHDSDGRERKQLTAGEWEVTDVSCVDEKTGTLWFVSSEKSPLERHLYTVSLDGGARKVLSRGEGTHSATMSPACDAYLGSYSNLENPSRSALYRADGSEIAVWREADRKPLEEFDILKTELHTFKAVDGTILYGRLIKPSNFDATKKYPVIVQVYGGPHAQSVRNAWMGGVSWDQALAHRGFLVWQMDNRGSWGRGHAFETPLFRRMGRAEVEDQKEGVRYLVSLGFADPARVGINGWSYGGYMALQCLLHAPDVFKAGIAGAAVSDWRNYDTIYTERYMGLPQENEEGYRLSSLVHHAANLKGKLLLVHNMQDDNVLFGNALQMMNALQQANKPFETLIYPQKSHGVMGKARTHMNHRMTEFFEKNLK